MKKLTGLFMVLSTLMFSQQREIGAAVLSLNTFNSYNNLKDTAGYTDQKSFIEFRPVLSFHQITAKDLEYYIQGGYFYLPSKTDTKNYSQLSHSTTYYNGKSLKKSVFIKVGFGKRTNLERLIFLTGANVSFEYLFYQKGYTHSYFYNSNNMLITHSYFEDTKSPEFIVGFNLQQSVYYRISSHFLVGIDLNLGIQSFLLRGERKIIDSHKDLRDPQFNYHLEYSIFYKSNYTSLNFQPNLSVRYILSKREDHSSMDVE